MLADAAADMPPFHYAITSLILLDSATFSMLLRFACRHAATLLPPCLPLLLAFDMPSRHAMLLTPLLSDYADIAYALRQRYFRLPP